MDNHIPYLVLFAGAFLSGLGVLFFRPKITSNIKLILSFSGAFLFAICILHLIPELYYSWNSNIGYFILFGFFLQLLLEYMSKGIEHGHIHLGKVNIKSFPFSIFLSLCIHSFVEGMALVEMNHAETPGHSHSYHFPLLIGVVIHKVPIALVLVSLLFSYHLKTGKVLTALLAFSLSAPIGLFIGNEFGHSLNVFEMEFNFLLAIAVGIFLHISTTILFETSENHKFNLYKFISIILGVALAFITS